ncbi:DUF1286 domain-containing protein [Pyrobaculum sp.]|uniref:DUF1286 domain-containing protein n=1 Tax=Pyrobaculum sp. TaxID=2004705 RepID=UPI003D09C37D
MNTHMAFSTAVGFLALLYLLAVPPTYALATAAILSFINPLIDFYGHERGRRSPRTHEPLHATVLGAVTGGFLGLVFAIALHVAPWASAVVGAIEALSHLLLDAFTEHGIYVRRNGRYERFAFAHLRHNDPMANGLTTMFSLLAIIAGFLHSPHP